MQSFGHINHKADRDAPNRTCGYSRERTASAALRPPHQHRTQPPLPWISLLRPPGSELRRGQSQGTSCGARSRPSAGAGAAEPEQPLQEAAARSFQLLPSSALAAKPSTSTSPSTSRLQLLSYWCVLTGERRSTTRHITQARVPADCGCPSARTRGPGTRGTCVSHSDSETHREPSASRAQDLHFCWFVHFSPPC